MKGELNNKVKHDTISLYHADNIQCFSKRSMITQFTVFKEKEKKEETFIFHIYFVYHEVKRRKRPFRHGDERSPFSVHLPTTKRCQTFTAAEYIGSQITPGMRKKKCFVQAVQQEQKILLQIDRRGFFESSSSMVGLTGRGS